MRRLKHWLALALLLLFALSLCGCKKEESFTALDGVQYTSAADDQGPVLVVADNGKGSITYTYPGCDIAFGNLAKFTDDGQEVKAPTFDVTVSTKTQPVGDCQIDGNQYSITYTKCLMSVSVEGEDREVFIEYAKQDCKRAYDQGEITKEEKTQYLSLLDGKVINTYEGSVSKLVVGGTIDSANHTMTMDSLAQYDTEGRLWQVSKFNSDGVIVYKERYNEAGVTVGVFEKYEDGQTKSITWYNDDGSFMSSEEYVVENGVKTKAIYKAEDGHIGIEYFKNGIITRSENTDSSGIHTWAEYNEQGIETKYTVVTGGNDEYYRIGLFVLNPITEEYVELEGTAYSYDGAVIGRECYTYDDNYHLIKVLCYNANGVIETEERFDEQGRSIYWYSIYDEVYIYIKYDGAQYDRYTETYTMDNTLIQMMTEKDGQVHFKSLQPDGTWREETVEQGEDEAHPFQ